MYGGSIPPSTSIPVAALLGLLAAGCHAVPGGAYLWLPLSAQADGEVTVDVPLAELRRRMEPFDPSRLAVHVGGGGRSPRPFVLVDGNGDGVADSLRVVVPVQQGEGSIAFVCPGQPAPSRPAPRGREVPYQLHFDRARR